MGGEAPAASYLNLQKKGGAKVESLPLSEF